MNDHDLLTTVMSDPELLQKLATLLDENNSNGGIFECPNVGLDQIHLSPEPSLISTSPQPTESTTPTSSITLDESTLELLSSFISTQNIPSPAISFSPETSYVTFPEPIVILDEPSPSVVPVVDEPTPMPFQRRNSRIDLEEISISSILSQHTMTVPRVPVALPEGRGPGSRNVNPRKVSAPPRQTTPVHSTSLNSRVMPVVTPDTIFASLRGF